MAGGERGEATYGIGGDAEDGDEREEDDDDEALEGVALEVAADLLGEVGRGGQFLHLENK